MTDNAQHADLKRMWSGWISLVLFVLLIPLSNWVIVNLGVVCPPGEPCLVPVLPGLWAPSTVLLAGFSLVLRDVVHHCLGWRWALASIFFGAVLSGFISEPSLVVASVSAFLFAELADFAVYAPMKKRYPAMAVIVSGLIGSVPTTTYGENIGVMAVTKVYSVRVIAGAAVLSIICSFIGKLSALIQTIPGPVIGGISFLLYGMIGASGIRILVDSKVDYGKSRNLILTSVIFVTGLSGITVTFGSIQLTGMVLACVVGMLMGLIFYILDKFHLTNDN